MSTQTIRHRVTGAILYSGAHATMREAVVDAVKARARLSGARLSGARLSGADLSGARLAGANLSGADLSDARLSGADLTRADLSGANLWVAKLAGAKLAGAKLADADLSGTDLSGTDLSDADLSGTDLSGTDLSDADLSGAKLAGAKLAGAKLADADLGGTDLDAADWGVTREDLLAILRTARDEVPALLASLREGRVDGSTYEGDCKCLVGTLAAARGVHYSALAPAQLRPAERLFLAISPGETPATNRISAMVVRWIEAWVAAGAT